MSSAFRRLSKSSAGTLIMAFILVLILVGFAMGDIQSIIRGGGISGGADTMAKVGSDTVSDRDVSRAMERRLSQVRQQKPDADYPAIAGDFDPLLNALIDAKALEEFARKNGFILSKRLEDGQIAQLPNTKGLDGKFSEQAYRQFLAQQRMTDQEIRMVIRNGLLQQLLIAPVAVNARAPVGMATPYASILLEAREAEVALVPTEAFRPGLNPSPADLQNYYNANRTRYMVPEQRVIRYAPIIPSQLANVQPTDKEIADYYAANTATYGAKETRVISRAIVPDQAAAQAIVNRVRSGQTFAAASAPAGLTANDISVGPQTRAEFTDLAGDKVAAATFAAQEGTLVGPIQSDVGWNVVKVDQIKREGGKPVAAVRPEIVTKLTTEKRKEAVENLVDKVQTALDDGSNFSEAAGAAKLQVSETPPVTADGRAPANPDFKLAPEVASAVLKSGFDLGEGDEPVVETLPNDAGYVMVEPARIIAAAPAPLASIRVRVAQDWIAAQAAQRAKQLADSITAKGAKTALAEAAKGATVPVRIEPVNARRIQLSRFQGKIPPPLQAMFSMAQGKVRTVAGSEGEGYYVVKVNKIIPGNALAAPGLIGSTQREMQEAMSQEYGLQILSALRKAVGVKRNDTAIAATKTRIAGGGS
jgi:peptidyl-prolyl cis-trans isomerase D